MKPLQVHNLTGTQANQIIMDFIPTGTPVFIDDLGCWKVGRKYYRLWQDRQDLASATKAIVFSNSPDRNAPQYLVQAWGTSDSVSNKVSEKAILAHARSYDALVVAHGILKKTRHRNGKKDTYYSKHIAYEVHLRGDRVSSITASLFIGDDSSGNRWHPGVHLWNGAADGGEGAETISKKEAELIVCKHFTGSLKRSLASRLHVDPELEKRGSAHFYAGHVPRIVRRSRIFAGAEKIDTGIALLDNIISVFSKLGSALTAHPVALLWGAAAIAIESRSFLRMEDREMWPGSVSPKDPLVIALSNKPEFAPPLSNFMRPIREEAFSKGLWTDLPVFGELALFNQIHRIPSLADDGMMGLSQAHPEPIMGSTVRFYWNQNPTNIVERSKNVAAIKIFSPNGLTDTIFEGQTRFWISHEPEREFAGADLAVSSVILETLKPGYITELANNADGSKRLEQLTFSEADAVFQEKFGGIFRTPHGDVPVELEKKMHPDPENPMNEDEALRPEANVAPQAHLEANDFLTWKAALFEELINRHDRGLPTQSQTERALADVALITLLKLPATPEAVVRNLKLRHRRASGQSSAPAPAS